MKRRWLLPIAAAGLSTVLIASAAAEDLCTPVEPKKWEGTLKVGSQGWAGATLFSQGCTWNGADALNESDTIVWDVSGYGGVTASITQSQTPGLHRGVQGYFYNESCERGGGWGFTEPNTPYAVGIPEGAKWFVAYQQYGGAQTKVTMETAGRTCAEDPETTKPPKKKKKPKRP
jgi:hypothetical protein